MFPWEHLAVGYLCYSLFAHLRGRTPNGPATLAVVVGTQFPDLVDKPLSWALNVLPAGVFAHSLFVAIPLTALVLVGGWRIGRTEPAIAFTVGYLSHLPGDVLPSIVLGGDASYWFLFWPAVARPGVDVSDPIVGPGAGAGIVTNAWYYFQNYLGQLATPKGLLFVAVELLVLGSVLLLWLRDGRPGTGLFTRFVGRHSSRH
ncbi:metal-dependent hydrolase [Halococcus saccharolyticus]|uniref:Membrane-bound metal-dependent hydrolase n=1 Tax=Halococcus saccharolyticus DSM 5350 TaxID=1227455 RepID=M0MLN7_9EURY|nr:metal-dependent hydrolase [Halococcus saccharolyticus]EMA45365.1 membrane-bound metal-dependent hydrolase [Halococcus saccharolyticus DSM 5350]